jgi:hypothetical protein
MMMSRPSAVVANAGGAEKSQSGPVGFGQFSAGYGMPPRAAPGAASGGPAARPRPPPRPPGIVCGQPLCHTSSGSACIVHRTLPVSMWTAMIALAVFGVPEKALPVPK